MPTGHANPSCYAGRLHDCSLDLSDEPYLSGVVREAADPRRLLTVLPPLSHPIALARPGAAADGLCRRHHLLLGPLDREAARAVSVFDRFEAQLSRTDSPPFDGFALVSGPLLEAWLVKTYFGLLAAHAATLADRQQAAWRAGAGHVLLDVLFRGAPWPPAWGLWLPPSGHAAAAATDPVTGPFVSAGSTWGAAAQLGGFPLQLLLGEPAHPDAVYRPGGLIATTEQNDARTVLAIGWPDCVGGPPVICVHSLAATSVEARYAPEC